MLQINEETQNNDAVLSCFQDILAEDCTIYEPKTLRIGIRKDSTSYFKKYLAIYSMCGDRMADARISSPILWVKSEKQGDFIAATSNGSAYRLSIDNAEDIKSVGAIRMLYFICCNIT